MASVPKPAQGWCWPESLDAMQAAPNHHRVLFENDEVRVLDVHIPPGEIVPLHTHCWASVLHMMQWANIIRRDEHGNLLADTRREAPPVCPNWHWQEPYAPHTVENVDTVTLHAIAVELKR